ncbi:SDR family NAD(P)-dependent oxidoreductase [Croceicoccus sp. F390]|uniref:SDR family NAD(P)-dependent oxidoreductase n=1 Tax=Croceicoccus esteveae TaxID=3075597 RepID=A0ABU2ZEZ6_9SPHN|nr:SDR family NAD(P)-dependent oxidoreductase [Croceicoccus sp. F390]MDT0574936.1 SDR family NAD(P)-dependent oxidoreductase [Croceicoccus sp. F390]
MMQGRYEGKTALVTGAAAGIGAATARRLAAEGAMLALADRDQEGLAAIADALEAGGRRPLVLPFDAADAASCEQMVGAAVDALPQLDLVCNIAGIQRWSHFADLPTASWREVLAINLDAPFIICRGAIAALLKTKGCIINMASAAGQIGIAYTAHYCASKAGLIGLTKSIAVEHAAAGVRAIAVAPGAVRAGAASSVLPDGVDYALIQRLFPKLNGGESSEPEEIAGAVAWLGSEEARFVTGTVFEIDGGQLAG